VPPTKEKISNYKYKKSVESCRAQLYGFFILCRVRLVKKKKAGCAGTFLLRQILAETNSQDKVIL